MSAVMHAHVRGGIPIDENGLTPGQERFALYVASGQSKSDAYRLAYPKSKTWPYNTVNHKAYEMSVKPGVQARIRALRAAAAEMAMMTAADTLIECMRVARFDVRRLFADDGEPIPVHKLPDDVAAAVQSIEFVEQYEGTGADRKHVGTLKKYRIADKNAALDKLFKHFGLYASDNKQKGRALGEGIGEGMGRAITAIRVVVVYPDGREVVEEQGALPNARAAH